LGDALANALRGLSLGDMASVSKKPELVGPPAPNPVEVRQLQGREEEPKRNIMKDLAPLLAAQVLDILTTEAVIRSGGAELNPLPGMQSTVGRVGWGTLEAALAHLLTKNKPRLREVVVKNVLPGLHGALSMNNAAFSQGEDVVDMLSRGQY